VLERNGRVLATGFNEADYENLLASPNPLRKRARGKRITTIFDSEPITKIWIYEQYIMSNTLELAKQLIARRSLTPKDEGCLQLIGARMEPLGFKLEMMRCGEVDNLWARRGNDGPVVCFAGHTDVVPTGPVEKWSSDRSLRPCAMACCTAAAHRT